MPTYSKLTEKTNWEKNKSKSNWHFDYTRPPEEGADSYYFVCNFSGDFTDAISECLKGEHTSNFTKGYTGDVKKDFRKFNSTELDLALVKADPYVKHFERYDAASIPVFKRINDALGIEKPLIMFHNQRPNQCLPVHFDTFEFVPKEYPDMYGGVDFYANPRKYGRFVIMLEDWKIGQFFQFGNATWHQWKKGDCVTWNWEDMPHATGNVGYWDRPLLQITGTLTEKTMELMAKSNKDLIIEV